MAKISLLEWLAYIITLVGIVMGIFLYLLSSSYVVGASGVIYNNVIDSNGADK